LKILCAVSQIKIQPVGLQSCFFHYKRVFFKKSACLFFFSSSPPIFYLSRRRAQASKPAQVVPHKLTKSFRPPIWDFAAEATQEMPSRIIQPWPAQTESLNCPKLLVCSKVRHQQLRLSRPWMVEGETLNLLEASGRPGQDAATHEIVCPRLSLSPPYTFCLGWNTTVVGCGWPRCTNLQSRPTNRASRLLHWPCLLSKEGARTASPSDCLTSLLAVLCALM